MKKKKKATTSRALIIQSVVIFILSIVFIVSAFLFQEKLSHFRSLGLLGLFLINFFANSTVFLPAPGIASIVAGGAIYPPLLVAIVSALGASLGDMLGFFFGFSGKQLFLKKQSIFFKTIQSLFVRYADAIIFIFAFIPNPLFDGIGILAGAFSYSSGRFFVIMFLGRFLRSILLAYAGSKL